MQISRKRFELETWYQLPTNRKWPMVDRITAKGQGRDPNIFHARYFNILKTAQNGDSVITGHLYEMA